MNLGSGSIGTYFAKEISKEDDTLPPMLTAWPTAKDKPWLRQRSHPKQPKESRSLPHGQGANRDSGRESRFVP